MKYATNPITTIKSKLAFMGITIKKNATLELEKTLQEVVNEKGQQITFKI